MVEHADEHGRNGEHDGPSLGFEQREHERRVEGVQQDADIAGLQGADGYETTACGVEHRPRIHPHVS
jgi:hypothetical protein